MEDSISEFAQWIANNPFLGALAVILTILGPIPTAIILNLRKKIRDLVSRNKRLGLSSEQLVQQNEELSGQISELNKHILEYYDAINAKSDEIDALKSIFPNNPESMHILMHDLANSVYLAVDRTMYPSDYNGRPVFMDFMIQCSGFIANEFFVSNQYYNCARSLAAHQILDKYLRRYYRIKPDVEFAYRDEIEPREFSSDLEFMLLIEKNAEKESYTTLDYAITFLFLVSDYNLLEKETKNGEIVEAIVNLNRFKIQSRALEEIQIFGKIVTLDYPNCIAYSIVKNYLDRRTNPNIADFSSTSDKTNPSQFHREKRIHVDIFRKMNVIYEILPE